MRKPLSIQIEQVKELYALPVVESDGCIDHELPPVRFDQMVGADRLFPQLVQAVEEAAKAFEYIVGRRKSQGFAVTAEALDWLKRYGGR